MNQLGKLILLGLGAVGLAYSSMVNWEMGFIADSQPMDETVQPAAEVSNLDLNIHTQETFLEARVDLHDGK